MNVREHMQSFYVSAGKYACYALCIIGVARAWWKKNVQRPMIINETDALIKGIEKGFIEFNENNYDYDGNFYVKNPGEFLACLTGGKWSCRKESGDYVCKAGEYEVQFWAWSDANANNGIGHFIIPGENTLCYSKSVAQGKCYSKRIFKKIA